VDCGSALGLILIQPRLVARPKLERCLPEQVMGFPTYLYLLTYSSLLPTYAELVDFLLSSPGFLARIVRSQHIIVVDTFTQL